MLRGTGFIADRPVHQEEDRVQRPLVDEHVGLFRPEEVGSFARERDWRHLVDRIYDQGPTEACVWFTRATTVYLRGRYEEAMGIGPRVKRPSAAFGWALTRLLDQAVDGVPLNARTLVNVGCRPRTSFLVAQEHGLVAEDRWPFDPEAMNVMPPLDADVAGADALLTGWYPIGAERSFDLMCASVDRGQFPELALDVYDNYYDVDSAETYDEPRGQFRGGHMLPVVAYRPDALCVAGSWGIDHGELGYSWLSRRLVESSYVRARYVVTSAPASR